MIHPCKKQCESKVQDGLYGKGRRVHNEAKHPSPGVVTLRCTVCKNEDFIGRKETLESNGKESKSTN